MEENVQNHVLGRKAHAGLRAFEARAMSLHKALRRAFSKAADDLWDLVLVAKDVRIEHMDQDGVVQALEAGQLLMLLDGPDAQPALVAIDRQVLAASIEVQTIQQVTQMPVDDRPLTSTDAAMVAPLIDGALTRFETILKGQKLSEGLTGFRYGAMIEDIRAAGLLLDAAGYLAFRVQLDIALGRREGVVTLFLPDRATTAEDSETTQQRGDGPYSDRLAALPTRLRTVMTRLTLPLSTVEKLKPGDTLELPANVMRNVELVSDLGGVVARGQLGQLDGMRALRLAWPPSRSDDTAAPDFETTFKETDTPSAASPALVPVPVPQMPDPAPVAAPDANIDFAAEAAGFDFDLSETAEMQDFGTSGAPDFDVATDFEVQAD